MAIGFHRLKIQEVQRETPSTVSISLDVPTELRETFEFQAGQYLTFRATIAGEELRRSYSLCSVPSASRPRVAVKQVPDGRFSTWANQSLKEGMEIEVMAPMGNFMAQSVGGVHIAFAAGSGITPIRAILEQVLDAQSDATFKLYYGSKTYEEIIFREELELLQTRYGGRLEVYFILSQEQRAGMSFGRMDKTRLRSEISQGLNLHQLSAAYLCGPADMIFGLKEVMTEQGVTEDKLHFELFTTPDEAELTPQSESTLEEKSSGGVLAHTYRIDGAEHEVEVKNPDATILDIGLDHGLDLPFACQGGVCCTCRAKVLSGNVDMRQNFSLGDREVEEGFVLTCQSYSQGVDVVIDYDS